MGIRTKMMLGFIILASMLFISGAISVFELTKLGKSIKGLIHDNYKSIDYSRSMLDALDEQENALLFKISGDSIHSRQQFSRADKILRTNLDSASNNLNLVSEHQQVDSVRVSYEKFYACAAANFNDVNFSINSYISVTNPLLIEVNEHVKNLITINQQDLSKSAAFLETSAQRASLPGLIVIITSLIFTLIFTYLVHHYFVSPILRLTKGINDFIKFRKPFEVPLETKDEFYKLKESIVNLISLTKTSGRK
ncbi:MAG: MCP four helix bundle domain-containing protein [Bacteroidales bacterium]